MFRVYTLDCLAQRWNAERLAENAYDTVSVILRVGLESRF